MIDRESLTRHFRHATDTTINRITRMRNLRGWLRLAILVPVLGAACMLAFCRPGVPSSVDSYQASAIPLSQLDDLPSFGPPTSSAEAGFARPMTTVARPNPVPPASGPIPKAPTPRPNLNQALAHIEEGRFLEARDMLMRLDIDTPKVAIVLALVEDRLGNHRKALKILKRHGRGSVVASELRAFAED